MSFLDNLENNLKALESREERDGSAAAQREADHARAVAAAPWAERLRESAWTKQIYEAATRAGHERRTKVYIAWLGTTLRLESRGRRLDLRPEADGIRAVYLQGNTEMRSAPVTLEGDPELLVRDWLDSEAV